MTNIVDFLGSSVACKDDKDREDPPFKKQPRTEAPCGPGTLSSGGSSLLQQCVSGGMSQRYCFH